MRTHNEWINCKVGKCEIIVENDGRISHVNHGRIYRVREAAEKYIAARPKLAEALAAWMAKRVAAISAWKHETPHHRYDCDGGKAVETVDVERARFYVDLTGAVVITVKRGEG